MESVTRMEVQKWILDRHQHSANMLYTRSNFFLIAQSMTLVSYASIYGKCHTFVELIISFLGYVFALAWASLGIRDNRNMKELYTGLLKAYGGNEGDGPDHDKVFTKLLGRVLSPQKDGGKGCKLSSITGYRLPSFAILAWTLFIATTTYNRYNCNSIIPWMIALVWIGLFVTTVIYTFCISKGSHNNDSGCSLSRS